MPPHIHYVEPYFGSGAVLFRKPRSKVETINGIDGNVVNLFKVLRDRPAELAALVHMTPWSREEYLDSYEPLTGDPLEDSRRFIVRCWQAFGTRTNGQSGWKNEISGDQGKMVTSIWRELPDRILAAAERFRGIQIESSPALILIARLRSPEVLIYADPPYLGINHRQYLHPMGEEDHFNMLVALMEHPGPVILSAYEHGLYDNTIDGWTKAYKDAFADAGRRRKEVLWLNPVAAEMREGVLF